MIPTSPEYSVATVLGDRVDAGIFALVRNDAAWTRRELINLGRLLESTCVHGLAFSIAPAEREVRPDMAPCLFWCNLPKSMAAMMKF